MFQSTASSRAVTHSKSQYRHSHFNYFHGAVFVTRANRSSNSQEISHLSYNLQVHRRIHSSPPTVPILSQRNRVHGSQSHFLKTNFNIIPNLRLGLPSVSFHRFAPPKPCTQLSCSHTCYVHRPSHSS